MSAENTKKQRTLEEGDEQKEEGDIENESVYVFSDEDKTLALPFKKQNVTLKIGQEEFCVDKCQLMAASPMFAAMFKPGFKEATMDVVELKDKNPCHFIRFLRLLLPGYNDELTEETAHDSLPLVEEYQTETLKERIDDFLGNNIIMKSFRKKMSGDVINSLIGAIIEAEMYRLTNYLKAGITEASKIIHHKLTNNLKYTDISINTRLEVATLRCSNIDEVYEDRSTKNVYGNQMPGSKSSLMLCDLANVGTRLEPFMK